MNDAGGPIIQLASKLFDDTDCFPVITKKKNKFLQASCIAGMVRPCGAKKYKKKTLKFEVHQLILFVVWGSINLWASKNNTEQ